MLILARDIYNFFKSLSILFNSSMPKFSFQRNTINASENIISIIDSGRDLIVNNKDSYSLEYLSLEGEYKINSFLSLIK